MHVGGRGRRGWRHALRATALVAVLVMAVLLVVGLGALQRASSAIDRVPVDGLRSGDGPTHVLVVGSDSREDLSEEQRRDLTTGFIEGVRTDTIFVLSLEGGRAGILAFPRDLWVERCDGSVGRINAAHALGGPTCLVETVSDVSGLAIEHYVEVDFLGFHDLVEAVGGVEMCLDAPISDKDAGIDLPAGCQRLGGADALGYVRVRKIDNDLERIKRQQQFVRALAAELASPAKVTDVGRLYEVAGAAGAAVRADEGLGVVDILQLALGLRGVARGGLETATVPTMPTTIDGAAVLVPTDAADAVFADTASGRALRRVDDALSPGDVEVVVLNGTGVGGLAGAAADLLDEEGFRVVDVGNGAPPGITTIRHTAAMRAEAELLAARLPIRPVMQLESDLDHLVLVLGADYPDD